MNGTKKGCSRIIKCDMNRPDEKEAYEKLEQLSIEAGLPIRKIFSLLMKSITIDGFSLSIRASLNTKELQFATGLADRATLENRESENAEQPAVQIIQTEKAGRTNQEQESGKEKPVSETETDSQETGEYYKGFPVLKNGMLLGKDGTEISRFIADLHAGEK